MVTLDPQFEDEANQLGARAEELVKTQWCARKGITANKARDADRHGWDLHLEIPIARGHDVTLDQHEPLRAAYIQVKGKALKPHSPSLPSVDIKMRHWHAAVARGQAFFFAILQFNPSDELVDAHLVHVGEKLIVQTLKRLRELHAEFGSDVDLMEHTMRVTPEIGDRLVPATADAFATRLIENLKEREIDYVKWKHQIVAESGYPEKRIRGSLTIPADSPDRIVDEVTDFMLGRKESIRLTDVSADEVRFGIPISKIRPGQALRAELRLDAGYRGSEVSLVATATGFSPSRSVNGMIRTNLNGPFEIPADRRAFRIQTSYIDLQAGVGFSSCVVSLPEFEVPFLVTEDFAANAELVLMLSKPGSVLRIQAADGAVVDDAKVKATLDERLAEALKAGAAISAILKQFGSSPPTLSLRQLMQLAPRVALASEACGVRICNPTVPGPRQGLQLEVTRPMMNGRPATKQQFKGRLCGRVFAVSLPTADGVLILILRALGRPTLSRAKLTVRLHASVAESWCGQLDDSVERRAQQMHEHATAMLEAENVDVLIVDMPFNGGNRL